MSNNIVKLERKTDKLDKVILEFIKDRKCIVITFDDNKQEVNAISNFDPGLRETTLLHYAYIYLMGEMLAGHGVEE